MQTILEKAKEDADFIIIDSPPVLAVADSGIISRIVDGVILVVRPGSTTTSTLRQAVEQLRRLGANIIGVVMNGMDLRSARYSYYYRRSYGYYYRYYTSADGVRKKKVAKSY
jgi:succinoglycan biosynthesis transport protein ExoP